MSSVQSFAPVVAKEARVLILGSMPGKASLHAQQYYAHPRNLFWPLIAALLGFEIALDYEDRCRGLTNAGIALWDVLQSCDRTGSLDVNIEESSIVANDFNVFLRANSGIEAIFFNGAMAERSFLRYVHPKLREEQKEIALIRLPSTSPAHAALTFQQKLDSWRQVVERLDL